MAKETPKSWKMVTSGEWEIRKCVLEQTVFFKTNYVGLFGLLNYESYQLWWKNKIKNIYNQKWQFTCTKEKENADDEHMNTQLTPISN